MLNAMFLLLVIPPLMQEVSSGATTRPAKEPGAAAATGAMRVELATYQELRSVARDAAGSDSTKSESRIALRLLGSRVGDVRRYGNPVFSTVIDDKGQSLIDPSLLPADYADQTRRQPLAKERVADQGIALETRLKAASRGAASLSKVNGSVRVIYAAEKRGVYFDNPRQYMGQPLQDQLLTDLGIEIIMLPPDDPPQMKDMANYVAVRVLKGAEKIDSFEICDAWLRPMRTKQSTMKTKTNDDCDVIALSQSIVPQNAFVIDVYPTIEDVRVPIQLDGLKLP